MIEEFLKVFERISLILCPYWIKTSFITINLSSVLIIINFTTVYLLAKSFHLLHRVGHVKSSPH